MTFYAPPLQTQPSGRSGSLNEIAYRKGRGAFSLGFGLVDTLLTFALVVLLSAATYGLFGPVTEHSAVLQESERLDALVSNVQSTYVSGVDYGGLALTPIVTPGFQPTWSVWNQPFAVLPTTVQTNNDAWTAIYQSVPAETCTQLGESEWSKQRWYAIDVDGNAVNSAADLMSACSASSPQLHSLQFVSYSGVRPNGTSGLPSVCFDRTRQQVAAGDVETGCPTNPSDYSPASLP